MKDKPAYQELEKQMALLEKNVKYHVQSAADLRMELDQCRKHLDIAEVMLIVLDSHGAIMRLNRKGHEVLGYEEGSLIGKNWFETCLPQENRVMVREVFNDIIAGRLKAAEYYENPIITKQGRELLIAWHNAVLTDETGRNIGTLSSGIDITEARQAEKALRESEVRYRRIISTVTDYIYHVEVEKGAAHRTVHGPACIAVTGYSSEEFAADPYLWIKMVPEEDHEAVRSQAARILSGMDPGPIQHHIRRKDGAMRWVSNTPVLYKDTAGELVSYDGLIRDITERKQIEKLTQIQRDLIIALSSTNHLQEALTLILQAGLRIEGFDSGGIYLVDADSGDLNLVVHAGLSPGFIEMTSHYSADSPSSKLIKRGRPVFTRHSQVTARMDDVLKQEGLLAMAILPVIADGRVIAGMNLASHTLEEIPPVDRTGLEILAAQISGAIARLRTQEALRKSEEKFRDLVENINEVIYTLDEKGTITYANPMLTTMLGYQPSEVIGRPFASFTFAEDLAQVKEQFDQVISNQLEPRECRVRTKSGEPRWIRASSRPVYEQGKVTGIQGVATDITAVKHLEAQLRQAQKMEAIGTLAGGIAHDFNNILGIILGNAELALLDIHEWSPSSRHLEEIRKACFRARDVVQQILSFSRQTEIARKPLKLTSLIRESLKLLRSSIPSSIEIQQHLTCTKDTILADGTQINQVLLNLCANAVHAMREQDGILEIALRNIVLSAADLKTYPELAPGHYVRLSVGDTGHGIAPDIIDRVFEPYFTTKAVGEGTGLGLAVVHGIVKNHGGTIAVENRGQHGTVFNIFLPLISSEPDSRRPAIPELPRGHERILFVEDEPAIAETLSLLMQRLGYSVDLKLSPLEALALFQDQPQKYDLVMTDQTMPVMTGMSLAKEILQIRPDIPIILFTGFNEQVHEENAKALGIKAFILKPVMLRELAAKLREALGAAPQPG